MELYCTPNSEYTTVKHSRKLFEHAYTSDPHGLGTSTPIEFFQQDLLWESSNTHSNSCSQKASKHKSGQSIVGLSALCTPQSHLGTSLTCHLPAPTIGYLHSNDSQTRLSKSIEVRRQQSRYYGTQLQLVYIVAWQLKVRPSIIVAYLRKPHICNNINKQGSKRDLTVCH
jgi:hypothetical protein